MTIQHTRTDASGIDTSGLDAPGLDRSGLDAPGLDRSGLDAPGLDRSGLDTSEFNTSGLDTSGIVADHIDGLAPVLLALRAQSPRLTAWGTHLAVRLLQGGRLLAAGNGGSAAEAQHLTAELVGRFDGDRRPFSAIALHADTSSVTAIANDYGFDEVYARQVQAHARAGDVVILLSTSGMSPNLVRAAEAARSIGATTWALTGGGPNALCEACDDHIALPGRSASVQEAQLVAVHSLCRAFDAVVRAGGPLLRAPLGGAA